jgi:hypothetical protein
VAADFQAFAERLDVAFTQHAGKQEMKIQEDPWDNYLYYDSKYLVPLFCDQKPMDIHHQVLAAYFIQRAVAEESIS